MCVSIRRRLPIIVGSGLVLVLTAACGSGGDSGGQSSPVATADNGATATRPATGATPPRTTPTSKSGQGDAVPTFAAGGWTGGTAEARITGRDTRTITGTLLAKSSSSKAGTTRLTYAGGPTGIDTIAISISTEYQPFDMTASQESFSVRVPYGNPACTVTYQETSASRIAGTFRCDGAEIEIGPNQGPAVMEGSFTATR